MKSDTHSSKIMRCLSAIAIFSFTATICLGQTPSLPAPGFPSFPGASSVPKASSSTSSTASKVPLAPSEPPSIPEDADEDLEITLNFHDVDIGVFIKFIADLTKKTFLIDDRVKGKVTILSHERITPEEAYKVFLSVLEIHGFTTVPSGKVIKIVTSPDARSKSVKTLLTEESLYPDDKVVTQLISMKFADVNEVKRLLSPLISKNSVILSYQPTNMLIITDVLSNIQRLMKIIKNIDVTGIGQEITVIPLIHSDAAKMEKIMASIFQPTRTGKSARGTAIKNIKFVSDERTNTIVVLASKEDTKRIRGLLKMLDKGVPKGKELIHVYYLEHATAEDLATTLQSLSSKKPKATTAPKGKTTAPVVSEAVNITADKATNSLIIMAEKEDYLVLEAIISKLDIPRAMVYIECLIMEVNVEAGFNVGAEWVAGGETSYEGTRGAYGGGYGADGYPNVKNVYASGPFLQGLSLGIFSEGIQIGNALFPSLSAVVQALSKDKRIHILSTPQILTTDNEEASILVGKNVPYQTKTGTTSTSETYNTYEYKDVAISLKVTPQISKDRMIRLKIAQETSRLDITSGDTGAERPTTLKRTIDTTVIVHNENTIVIGGLIDDSFNTTEYKIPCLGDIPGLGWLFKTVSNGDEKTNLFLFLTPHVIKNSKEANTIYKEKKKIIDTVSEGQIKMYGLPEDNEDASGDTATDDPDLTTGTESEDEGGSQIIELGPVSEEEKEFISEDGTVSIPWDDEEGGSDDGQVSFPPGGGVPIPSPGGSPPPMPGDQPEPGPAPEE